MYLMFPNSLTCHCGRALLLLTLSAGILAGPAVWAQGGETPVTSIKVDQVGYPLHGPKVALVSVPAKTFEIRRVGDGQVVFEGKMGPAQFDPDSGDTVEAADFSGLQQAGDFYVQVPGVGRSWDFHTGDNVFDRTYYLAMRAFYGQRCGTAVDHWSGVSRLLPCNLSSAWSVSFKLRRDGRAR